MLCAGSASATVYMAMMVGLPLALHRDGIVDGWAGALIAVSAVTVILGRRLRLTRTDEPFGRMRTGYALLATGLFLAVLVTLVLPTGAPYLVPVVVWSLGEAVLLGEPLAVVAALAPHVDRGRYLAVEGLDEVAAERPHLGEDHGLHRASECGQIDVGVESGDHAISLQTPHAFRAGGRGGTDLFG